MTRCVTGVNNMCLTINITNWIQNVKNGNKESCQQNAINRTKSYSGIITFFCGHENQECCKPDKENQICSGKFTESQIGHDLEMHVFHISIIITLTFNTIVN